ncbi:hypothetical protein ABTY98_42055, partial [Streptomyces sp. NPDC096040]
LRLLESVKRRVDVVQVFTNDDALLRLVTAVLFERGEGPRALPPVGCPPDGGKCPARRRIAFPRRYLPEGSMDQLYPAELPDSAPALPNTTNTP